MCRALTPEAVVMFISAPFSSSSLIMLTSPEKAAKCKAEALNSVLSLELIHCANVLLK